MSQLGKSWIFLNRLIWKVGMKWTTIEEEEGVNILLKYVCCVIWATSRKNTHTVRSRPTTKREIRRFRNGLVGELKVHERKLLRQSKTLCSNRRNQFLEREDNTS